MVIYILIDHITYLDALTSDLHKAVVTGHLRITVEYHTLTHSITEDQGN